MTDKTMPAGAYGITVSGTDYVSLDDYKALEAKNQALIAALEEARDTTKAIEQSLLAAYNSANAAIQVLNMTGAEKRELEAKNEQCRVLLNRVQDTLNTINKALEG